MSDMLPPCPVATLRNGLTVANFSSPHPFTFNDGTVLSACTEERSRGLSLERIEKSTPGVKGTFDIEIYWELTRVVLSELIRLSHDDSIDLFLVALPVMTAIKNHPFPWPSIQRKARCILTEDRVRKTIFCNKFCT